MAKKLEKTGTKLNASQKLENLEQVAIGMEQKMQILAQEIDKLGTIVQGLAKRINAAISAGENGNLSNDGVNSIIIDQNVAELKEKIDFLVKQGVIVVTDEVIKENSFVVGREVDGKGSVVNPRLQFAVQTLQDDAQRAMFLGKKTGDLVQSEDKTISIEIGEVYDIQDVKKEMDSVEEPR